MTLRVPYAFGVACNANNITGPGLTVSLLPVDPTLLEPPISPASPGATFPRRFTSIARTPATGPRCMHQAATQPFACSRENHRIRTWPGGSVVNLTASTIGSGTPTRGMNVFLYQRVRYRFATSTALPGNIALCGAR